MLRETGISDAEGQQLIAILDDPAVPPRTQVVIINLLVEQDHRPVAPQVEAFIERYRLKAIERHDRDANPERYPRLGIGSGYVLQWTEWLEQAEGEVEADSR